MPMSYQCPLTSVMANSVLGFSRKSVTSRLRDIIFPFYSVLVRYMGSGGLRSGIPSTRVMWAYWTMLKGLEHLL